MRKYIKQIFLLIICLLYLWVFTTRPVYAAGAEFVISEEVAFPGDNITVSIVNNSGIAVTSGQFDLLYDSKRFEIVGATLFQESVMPFYLEEGRTDTFRISKVPLRPDEAFSDQVIASITFKIIDSVAGPANFELVKSKIGYGNIGENVQNLEVSETTVGVNIMNSQTNEPVDPSIHISEEPDHDPPQQPSEDNHMQPQSDDPESDNPSESTKPTEPSEATVPTKLTDLTELTESGEPSVNLQQDGSDDSDKVANKLSESENRKTDTATSEILAIQTAGTTRDEIRIISTLAPVSTKSTASPVSAQAMIRTAVQTIETMPTIALAAIVSAETEEVLQNNTQTTKGQAQTMTANAELTTSATTTKTIPSTVQQTVENSQNTEINSINTKEQKQAKQEQAFKLTGNELNLHNKLMLGGLAITAIGSLGALVFLIIKNNLRLR